MKKNSKGNTLKQMREALYRKIAESERSIEYDFNSIVLPKMERVIHNICSGEYISYLNPMITYKGGNLSFLKNTIPVAQVRGVADGTANIVNDQPSPFYNSSLDKYLKLLNTETHSPISRWLWNRFEHEDETSIGKISEYGNYKYSGDSKETTSVDDILDQNIRPVLVFKDKAIKPTHIAEKLSNRVDGVERYEVVEVNGVEGLHITLKEDFLWVNMIVRKYSSNPAPGGYYFLPVNRDVVFRVDDRTIRIEEGQHMWNNPEDWIVDICVTDRCEYIYKAEGVDDGVPAPQSRTLYQIKVGESCVATSVVPENLIRPQTITTALGEQVQYFDFNSRQKPYKHFTIYDGEDEEYLLVNGVNDGKYILEYQGLDGAFVEEEKKSDGSGTFCILPGNLGLDLVVPLVAGELLVETEEEIQGERLLNLAYTKLQMMYREYGSLKKEGRKVGYRGVKASDIFGRNVGFRG